MSRIVLKIEENNLSSQLKSDPRRRRQFGGRGDSSIADRVKRIKGKIEPIENLIRPA